ncbi:ATP-binding protein [Cryptosporangium japonicum]|uniref:OmpR/PhoB-type domain-containing protein n=1 Tax=Cryptosporangium japonicum TaxID=80872 RepID=A0ABP3DXG8_9ACTN
MTAPTRLRLHVLGPLRIVRDGHEVDAGPRQQAYLLAVLLARANQPVGTGELVDLVWGDEAPPTAANLVQKYVGAVRRLLEPGLRPREAGSYLHRQGTGYRLVAGPDVLDLADFRRLVSDAESAQSDGRTADAFATYLDALALWRGAAGDDFSHGPAARAIFTALTAEFVDACVAAAELAASLARPAEVLAPLRLAVSMAPLHEPARAALASTVAAAGNTRPRPVPDRGRSRPAPDVGVVGRAGELATLRQVLESAASDGGRVVVVDGEPGAGKTRLLAEAGAAAERSGALVVWGHCLDGDGTPSMWPWVEAVGALLDRLPAASRAAWLAGELGRLVEPRGGPVGSLMLPDDGGRLRLFDAVAALLASVSAQQPTMLIVDDLQWADTASLALFGHLAARPPRGAVLVGALRTHAPRPGAELARVLAAAGRTPGHHHLRPAPFDLAEVVELVRRETGQTPAPAVGRDLHARTAGNPFFVRELARLLAADDTLSTDAPARYGVPSTVRDVVLDRMGGLDDDGRDLLRIAALLGRDIDLELLADAAGLDPGISRRRLGPAEALGLVGPSPESPLTYRFAHDLVREAVAGTTPPLTTHALHLRIADALALAGTSDDERLAHHLWSAAPLADPARTADALLRAGGRAASKSAFDAAEQHLWSAARTARTADLPERELAALRQLITVAGMRSMYGTSVLDRLARAEELAARLGREREAADFLFTRWVVHVQGMRFDRSERLARRLLAAGEASDDPVVQAYGRHAWGLQQWSTGDVGEALRYLARPGPSRPADLGPRAENPLRYDLRLLSAAMLGEVTALSGDIDGARALLDDLELAAGEDRYAITVWATISARTASIVGDPGWALRAAERGIAVDSGFSFVFLGTYQRLVRAWALAMRGSDPEGAAAEIRALLADRLLDPPVSCVATWYALLAEVRLAAGAADEAADALERAEQALATYGQRYAEGLVLLQRARLLQARGEPAATVRAAARRARAVSVERGAHLFARRIDGLLTELPPDDAP